MSWSKRGDILKLSAIVLWLVFTVAFALWWFKFSMDNITLLAGLEPERVEHWGRQRRMVFWEGSSWIVLLVIGGAALIALVQSERARVRRIREFFASFSHEIKTSLASLRLQAETLKDESTGASPILDRLVGDTVRLQLQLENSLFLSSQDSLQLYLEPLALKDLVERMREQWPTLQIELKSSCTVRADERAMRTILSNLLQNAIVHGGATAIAIDSQIGSVRGVIVIKDNGRGFDGDRRKLAQLFYRPKSTSGSGMGLYISRLLLHKMNGDLELRPGVNGFEVCLSLPGVSR